MVSLLLEFQLRMEDRLDRALEYADKVLEIEEDVEAMLIKAEALMRLNRVEESDEVVDRILEKQPDNIEAVKNKGRINERKSSPYSSQKNG
ncbi:MAG: tetratricopeptide repeat protein [Archaeoglobaceae archaeon]